MSHVRPVAAKFLSLAKRDQEAPKPVVSPPEPTKGVLVKKPQSKPAGKPAPSVSENLGTGKDAMNKIFPSLKKEEK